MLDKLGLKIDLNTPVRNLPIAHRQVIEIAKALMLNARVVVMDEPTSSLTSLEADRLFLIVKQLREAGTALVFISHKLDEVRAIGDRFSVIKDGVTTGTGLISETTNDDLVKLMVAGSLNNIFKANTRSIALNLPY